MTFSERSNYPKILLINVTYKIVCINWYFFIEEENLVLIINTQKINFKR